MKFKINLILNIIIACALITSCGLFKGHSSQKEIAKIVKENQELLDCVPGEIKKLNYSSCTISTTEKNSIESQLFPYDALLNSNYKDIQGLYVQDGSNSIFSLKNDVLSEVLNINGVMKISNGVSDNRFFINFDCGGEGFGSAMNYHGFYYTQDNLRIGWEGEAVDLTQNDKGWLWKEAEDSDNIYYTERISDNWFYYKMSW